MHEIYYDNQYDEELFNLILIVIVSNINIVIFGKLQSIYFFFE